MCKFTNNKPDSVRSLKRLHTFHNSTGITTCQLKYLLKFAQKISNDYRRILEKIENYEPIGNDIFKSKTAKYHNLNWFDVIKIKRRKTPSLFSFLTFIQKQTKNIIV